MDSMGLDLMYFSQNQNTTPINNSFYNNHNYADQVIYSNELTSNKLNKVPMVNKKMPIYQTPLVSLQDDFSGEFNFQFSINPNDLYKSNLVYSKKLSKIFVNMGHVLPLSFSWSSMHSDFLLRTTMVFRDDHDRSWPVQRCYAHMAAELPDNRGLGAAQLRHVFRTNHPGSQYLENAGVLSILTPLGTPALGLRDVPLDFQFYCKNSCPTGINRRPTKMVFTLEDHTGFVLGRRSLLVQICSCPKRDKDREEKELENPKSGTRSQRKKLMKRKPGPIPPPRDNPEDDADEDYDVHFLNLNILGEENYKAILKYSYDIMASQAMRTGNYQNFRPHMDEILQKLQQS